MDRRNPRLRVQWKISLLAYRRDWTAFQSLAGNNFFLITVFLLRQAGAFVYLIIGLVLLFPLSTDPLRKIPASRLALWPLELPRRNAAMGSELLDGDRLVEMTLHQGDDLDDALVADAQPG